MSKDLIRVDLVAGTVTVENGAGSQEFSLASAEGFAAVSRAWLRAGWDAKYVYSFTWLGRPVIQLPEDLIRVQEIIFRVKPDVLIETGVAHGGSLVFYASLFKAMGQGRVIGIDIEIRPQNRRAIEDHDLNPLIDLVEGDSIDAGVVARVKGMVGPGERVLVILDARHTKAHVLSELVAYAPLVTPGSYIVAADGIMASLVGAPRSHPDWEWNNPREAAAAFARKNKEFLLEEPPFPFNEGMVRERVTYWAGAFLRRVG